MFKISNSATTSIGSILDYTELPEYQRHVALQIGDIKLSIGGEINGWKLCNGQSLSRREFSDLYNLIGTSFGSVDSNHFNLPDYTSRVIGMFGPSAGESELTQRSMGDITGAEYVTLTVNQLPSHSHAHNAGGGSGTSGDPTRGLAYCDSFGTIINSDTTNGELNCVHSPVALTINNTGGGESFSPFQPTLFGTNVLIFAKFLPRTDMQAIQYKY